MLGEIEGGGWDGWMASPTWWTWIWVNSGSWWWTARPGVLQSMGLQRVGHDWATEVNWYYLNVNIANGNRQICDTWNNLATTLGVQGEGLIRHLLSGWLQAYGAVHRTGEVKRKKSCFSREADEFRFLKSTYLCIWLWQVLVTARRIFLVAACRCFSCGMRALSRSMWNLVLWPGIKPRPPSLGMWSISHWTIREIPENPRLVHFWIRVISSAGMLW